MTAVIEARGLRCAYPNGHEALRGVDLAVEAGERVALLGPNGAGKTTLMLAPRRAPARDRTPGSWRASTSIAGRWTSSARGWGLVFQDPDDQLFMPTVREDVAFGPLNQGLGRAETARRVQEALAAVRMDHAAERAPHELSMGERRRVAIATVLAGRPRLLVLDEPSASLDPRARRELLDVLEATHQALLVATHDLPLAAELCERVVILAHGLVVADGPAEAVLGDDGLLAEHDLELPVGFDLGRVTRRSRPHGLTEAAALPSGR